LAETYLASRALDLTDALAGPVLRFHAQCPWKDNTDLIYVPALLAAFRALDSDKITAVHRIALTQDGQKIDRRMLGVVRGAAIKLGPRRDGTLAVGEGVETCMAAQQLGYAPAWAMGSVGAIAALPVLERVDKLILLGETGHASASAIGAAGKRWRFARRTIEVVMPEHGSDLNDELMWLSFW
jgi:Toprim domain-containing protein